MRKLIKKYFLSPILFLMLILISCQTAYASPLNASTHKNRSIKYDQKKLAISHSLKDLNQCETSCAPDSLGCSKKEWLSYKDRINSTDRVHWRKICKIKISLCKKECLMDRGINANQ
jgi:hypothetical protein